MIDDIFELVIEILLDLIPKTVWKVLLLVFGVATSAIGAALLTESPSTGGVLLTVGVSLSIASLVFLYR